MSWHLREICGVSLYVSHRLSELNDYTMRSHLHSQIRQKLSGCKYHMRDVTGEGLSDVWND